LQQQKYEDALQAFLAATNLNPHDPELRVALGEVYFRLGRNEEALAELNGLKELHSPFADDLAKLMNSDSSST
jgi:Flp pilus assembly protein TadD